ncbi:hypothetical protein [Devosia aurantiaca]|uniref:Uncharacterized protein n=1 Tax=Devosia aurantiaca TaxID=2714858 RepID=A0A6M1SAM0_9HYPH|nr:hypothetical protein [Devosia aurantiaca]NGP16989.1 hypothetical protein [Devosia aurantiaca]
MKSGDPALLRMLDRIAPDPVLNSRAMGVPDYVAGRIAADPSAAQRVAIGVDAFLAEHDVGSLDDAELDAALQTITHLDWFALLARWAAEAIYADPGNGEIPMLCRGKKLVMSTASPKARKVLAMHLWPL